MLKNVTSCFAVIYIPFYALQCACRKRIFEEGTRHKRVPDQLSFDVIGTHVSRTGERGIDDNSSSDIPSALLDQEGMHVIELNYAAHYAGIQPGMSTSQALARASELILYKRNPSTEQHLQNTLLQLVYRYSPFIENSAPGICTLDLKGKRIRNHQPWLRELLAQLRSIGLKAQAGLGANPEIALQAAKIANPILEIFQDCHLLQSLALESLAPSPFLLDILKSWGIRTLGALTRLPREEIGQRLGLEALALWDRAAGRSAKVLQFVQPPETFEESIDFEEPLETIEPLQFILRRFLETLSLRIDSIYLLIAELRLMLTLEDGEKIVRILQIPAPTRNVDTLFGIAAQYLETLQTTAPVSSFHLEAIPSRPAGHQFNLFQGGLKDPNRFFQTLARLAALVGDEKVGIPQRINTHQPDSLQMLMPELGWSWKTVKKNGRPKTGPGLRRYRPGIAARVELNDGKPVLMQSSLISGRIVETRGPWKLSGNWWDSTRWETKEWDIALENGGLYRIARKTTNFSQDQRKASNRKGNRSRPLAIQDQWEVVGVYD
ncbi:MAG: DNA polymerase Y family protein [Verrucomicrobia bacterium]|nr:DNA polymerase Y family protein [Verrucomicrobiota bacterium]